MSEVFFTAIHKFKIVKGLQNISLETREESEQKCWAGIVNREWRGKEKDYYYGRALEYRGESRKKWLQQHGYIMNETTVPYGK